MPEVTLLTPPEYVGQTAAKQTEVFLYFKEKPAVDLPIYLTLSRYDESRAIIEKQIKIENKGITQIQLPIELEVGLVYQWSVTLVCSPHPKRIDENEEVSGLIERVIIPKPLTQKINQASEWEQAKIYASLGIWHESLQLTQNSPQFSDLLEQVGIHLEK